MPQDSGTELRLAQNWRDTDADAENLLLDDNADTESDSTSIHEASRALKESTNNSQRSGRIVTKGQIEIHTRVAHELF